MMESDFILVQYNNMNISNIIRNEFSEDVPLTLKSRPKFTNIFIIKHRWRLAGRHDILTSKPALLRPGDQNWNS